MKTKLLLMLACIFLFAGCASYPVAQQSGKEDVGYLLFVSQNQFAKKTLHVELDNTEILVQAVKSKNANRKGKVYTVATGPRKIVVKDAQGNILYDKKIFVSAQETKQIQLP